MTDQQLLDPPATPKWDPLVRLTHWGIAAAIVANGLITEGGDPPHIWIGYAAASLLVLRILWGFIGVGAARFSAFPPSIRGALDHVGAIRRGETAPHRSHNPLGALMAYALWACLAIVVITGIGMAADPFPDDRSVQSEQVETEADERYEHGEEEEALEDLHELAANLLLFLALVHVGGVAFESLRTRTNLIGEMTWPGRTRG